MLSRKPPVPEDLSGIDAVLRDARPQLPADRMRFVAARARSRARASAMQHTSQKESFLRSRIAITLMLVLGFGFSTAGVGMAVQSVDNGAPAADHQYDRVNNPPLVPAPDRNEVQDEVDESPAPPATDRGGNDVAGERGAGDQVAGEQAQESRQLGAESGAAAESLPFTGFAAIPVLLMGFVLLTAGFVLRRRA